MLLRGMPLVSRIDSVHIYVRDMERSAAFYRVYFFEPPAAS